MKVFLTAQWHNLINLTYRVPREVLHKRLPKGLELDEFDGSAHVSLVAFDFVNTRVKGVKVPFHVDFPEVNMRFYVRYKGRRGVVFIREFVPKHCIAFIAQRFYNEPYSSFPMESHHVADQKKASSTYKIWKDKNEASISAVYGTERKVPDSESAEHYFKEHETGFGIDKKGETLCYEVEHPVWETLPILETTLNLDFAKIYGEEWAFLNGREPDYQIMAVGSDVKVFHPMSLEGWEKSRMVAATK